MITVSPLAATKLNGILEGQKTEGVNLRLLVIPVGQGVQYSLALDRESRDTDITVESNGVKLLVDTEVAEIVEGAEIDYVEDLMRSGFVISNPNFSTGGCACGGNCACGGQH